MNTGKFIVFAAFMWVVWRFIRQAEKPNTSNTNTPFLGFGGGGSSSGGGGTTPPPLDYTMSLNNNVYRFDFGGARFEVDLTKGGVLSWIGTDTINSVDDRDLGRFNGGSIYSNPEPLIVPGGITTTYAAASWNPVQAGNDGNLSPTITSHTFDADTKKLTVVLRPLQWKYRNFIETDGTTLTVEYTLLPSRKALKAKYTWNINRPGENHSGRADETGFFYFKRPFDQINSYGGNAPFTNAPAESIAYNLDLFYPNGNQHANQRAIFDPTERWVAIGNGTLNVGIILRSPNTNTSNADLRRVDTDGGYMLLQRNHTYNDTGTFTKVVERDIVIDTVNNVRAYAYDVHNAIV